MPGRTSETGLLLSAGSPKSRQRILAELFMQHRGRLGAMVRLRLDPRLRRRVDPSDILQDTYIEAARRLDDYLFSTPVPFYLWLRSIAGQKLLDLHRRHLGARLRDARREVPLDAEAPEASSVALAAQLAVRGSSPSEIAMKAETRQQVQEALERMTPQECEIIALRHVEELTNAEAARVLGIAEKAAGQRYLRALKRLQEILARPRGGAEKP